MKKIFLILLVIMLWVGNVIAKDYYSNAEWFTSYESSDYISEGIFLGLTTIDYFQTSEFRRDGKREGPNPCLGHYPDQGRINACIGLGVITHAFVTYAIPREYRPLWHTFSITLESVAVYTNYQAGYGVKFNYNANF